MAGISDAPTQKDTHVHIECNVVTFPDKKVIVFLKIYFGNRFNQSNSSESPFLVYYSIPWLYSQVSQSVYQGKWTPESSFGHQNLPLVTRIFSWSLPIVWSRQ